MEKNSRNHAQDSGIREETTNKQPQVSYCIMTSCEVEKGSVSSVIRPEYLCEESGSSRRTLATRTLYWESNGTLIESEWRKTSGTAGLPKLLGREHKEVREVSREEAVSILLTADKIRKAGT